MNFKKEGVITKNSPEFAMLSARQTRIDQLKEAAKFLEMERDNLQMQMENEDSIRDEYFMEYLKYTEDLNVD